MLGESGDTKTATVRLKAVKTKLAENSKSSETFVVTLSYEYQPTVEMLEAYRVENPLGFVVTSYRKDKEL